jgi:sulfur carrier protein
LKIQVNGKGIDFAGSTVLDLIESYRLDQNRIVVELNGGIVHREEFASAAVADGDVIELVRFVGGG